MKQINVLYFATRRC